MKRIAMVFPDYGSQYVGMAKDLYDTSRVMQEYFDEASNCLGINFIKLCFASSEQDLFKIDHAYTALFLVGSSLAAFLKEQGITPSIVAGYGIGEFCAVHTAGGLNLADSLYLLNKYALFFSQLIEKSSISVAKIEGLKSLVLKKLCALSSDQFQQVAIAGYLSSTAHIVSGSNACIQLVERGTATFKGTFSLLRPQVGFHSKEMMSVVKELKKYLTKIDFKSTSCQVAMSVDGEILKEGDFIRRRLIKQLHNPVRWDKVMKLMHDYDCIIQVGPGTTLSSIAKKYFPDKPIFSFSKKSDMSALSNMLLL